MKRIDWAITKGYLSIDYLGRLPVLTFTAAGWKIEQNTYSDELLMKLTQIATGPVQTADIQFLKDKNRSFIFMLLDKIEAGKDERLLSVLEEWRKIDYKESSNPISEAIQSLKSQKKTPRNGGAGDGKLMQSEVAIVRDRSRFTREEI